MMMFNPMTEELNRNLPEEYTLVNKVYGHENSAVGDAIDMIGYDDAQAEYLLFNELKQAYNRPVEPIKDYSDLEAIGGIFIDDVHLNQYCLVINLDANLVILYELI